MSDFPKWFTLPRNFCISISASSLTFVCRRSRCALALLAPIAGVLLFAVATADATVETWPVVVPAISRPPVDPRAARLEGFFKRYNCPAPKYIADYLRVADQNGLDYRLLPAISIRETQCGIHGKNNNWLGFHPETARFSTPLAGIEFIAHRLAEHPYYKGKSLEKKLFTYNPFPTYPGEVQRIMRQIEP